MPGKQQPQIRDSVYVVGAGFSAGLGYPMTNTLLTKVWRKLAKQQRLQLQKIIEFHHPEFQPTHKESVPDMERLLTEIGVNLELFNASRPTEGRFRRKQHEDSRDSLLLSIGSWFHELFDAATQIPWLPIIVEKLKQDNAVVVSFNWDLIFRPPLV